MNSLPMFAKYALLVPLFACFTVVAGCNKGPLDQAQVAEYRTSFTLADEPDGAQSVLDVRAKLTGEPAHDHAEHDHAEHGHDEDAHTEHSHDEHEGHDHAERDAAAHASEEATAETEHAHDHAEDHEGHSHEEAGEDAHAGHAHGHDEEAHDEHAGHDHAAHDHDAHGHASGEVMDVVLVGALGGVANPWEEMQPEFPFAKDEAVLYLVDAAELAAIEGHGHQHAPGEECAFCAAHAGDTSKLLARVEFKGKDGKPLAVGSRQLFDLKEKEMVVVRGKARMAPGGMLVVDATGLFVRR